MWVCVWVCRWGGVNGEKTQPLVICNRQTQFVHPKSRLLTQHTYVNVAKCHWVLFCDFSRASLGMIRLHSSAGLGMMRLHSSAGLGMIRLHTVVAMHSELLLKVSWVQLMHSVVYTINISYV